MADCYLLNRQVQAWACWNLDWFRVMPAWRSLLDRSPGSWTTRAKIGRRQKRVRWPGSKWHLAATELRRRLSLGGTGVGCPRGTGTDGLRVPIDSNPRDRRSPAGNL